MTTEQSRREYALWKPPAFNVGDVVEVIAYPEWKGDLQYVAEVRRRVSDGQDLGSYTYATWPLSGRREGLTDGWEEKDLRLIEASRASLLVVLESPELVEEVASAIDSNAFIGTKSPRHHVSHWENVFEKRKGRARKLAQSAISTIITKLYGEK